jgi:hypothetical protein
LIWPFGQKKQKFFAACEYWVYLPGEQLPPQDALMTRLIAENPYGRSAIGPREGLLFSDVRLHISLALRQKNAHVFRPDLFSEDVEVRPELLAGLSDAKSFVKLRYISEEPLKDARHLQFMTHLADAVAALGSGSMIFDVVCERLMLPSELTEALAENPDATRPELHLRVIWRREGGTAHAATLGLMKKGIPEIVSAEADLDHEVLLQEVLLQGATQIWNQGTLPEEVTVSCFHDQFQMQLSHGRKGETTARILRIQTG